MKIPVNHLHSFEVAPKEAIALQKQLRDRVETEGPIDGITFAAGIDVGLKGGKATAAIAVLKLPELQLRERALAKQPVQFPYIPGLLSFREIPVVLDALKKLTTIPDILLCDGQGIAHPRRFGIASHLGVITGLRSIGVAKSRLTGTHAEVPLRKGDWVPLIDKNETIGAVLRTREGVKPLYISVGHRIDLMSSIEIVMRCITRYRLPETTRWSHRLAGE